MQVTHISEAIATKEKSHMQLYNLTQDTQNIEVRHNK